MMGKYTSLRMNDAVLSLSEADSLLPMFSVTMTCPCKESGRFRFLDDRVTVSGSPSFKHCSLQWLSKHHTHRLFFYQPV